MRCFRLAHPQLELLTKFVVTEVYAVHSAPALSLDSTDTVMHASVLATQKNTNSRSLKVSASFPLSQTTFPESPHAHRRAALSLARERCHQPSQEWDMQGAQAPGSGGMQRKERLQGAAATANVGDTKLPSDMD